MQTGSGDASSPPPSDEDDPSLSEGGVFVSPSDGDSLRFGVIVSSSDSGGSVSREIIGEADKLGDGVIEGDSEGVTDKVGETEVDGEFEGVGTGGGGLIVLPLTSVYSPFK